MRYRTDTSQELWIEINCLRKNATEPVVGNNGGIEFLVLPWPLCYWLTSQYPIQQINLMNWRGGLIIVDGIDFVSSFTFLPQQEIHIIIILMSDWGAPEESWSIDGYQRREGSVDHRRKECAWYEEISEELNLSFMACVALWEVKEINGNVRERLHG